MAQYFLLLDAAGFHHHTRPTLAASWRERHFEPCRPLCERLLSQARQFAVRYHLGPEEPLLAQVAGDLAFDRTLWQHLVGEVLWYSALEIPEIRTAEETLPWLVPDSEMPLAQLHHGSRPLAFAGGFYRPAFAGWNDVDDVGRLVAHQRTVELQQWRIEDLASWTALPAAEREEELEYARECWVDLQALYQKALDTSCVMVCETL